MRKATEILRLRWEQQLRVRQVAQSLSISHSTVIERATRQLEETVSISGGGCCRGPGVSPPPIARSCSWHPFDQHNSSLGLG
jgi:hypothetical protein